MGQVEVSYYAKLTASKILKILIGNARWYVTNHPLHMERGINYIQEMTDRKSRDHVRLGTHGNSLLRSLPKPMAEVSKDDGQLIKYISCTSS